MTIPDIPPDLQNFAQQIADILLECAADLEMQGVAEDERQATLLMIMEALKCRLTGKTPSSEEVQFWMRFLDPGVSVSENCVDQ